MNALTAQQIRALLLPYCGESLSEVTIHRMQVYLQVFEVWSKRVNLTTVREPEQVIQRHFGEGFSLARLLPAAEDVLDLGSGAGFPGLPIALTLPDTRVTLAEVQAKKSAFLKEVVASMQIRVDVWPRRAEELIGKRQFSAVALRAVDHMPNALKIAACLLRPSGTLAYFVGRQNVPELPAAGWSHVREVQVPGSSGHIVIAQLQ